jgi:hypothetical protein
MKKNLLKGYSIRFSRKEYENLVEALTNNDIAVTSAFSNFTLGLPQSSSLAFPRPYSQSNTCIKEELESFHNITGDC